MSRPMLGISAWSRRFGKGTNLRRFKKNVTEATGLLRIVPEDTVRWKRLSASLGQGDHSSHTCLERYPDEVMNSLPLQGSKQKLDDPQSKRL